MAKQYTLEEIKNIVYSGNVNTSNLTDLMSSLKDYDFNSEIRDIFVSLSNNENLPDTIRINFKNFIDSYSEMVEDNYKQSQDSTSSDQGTENKEELITEEKPQEFEFTEPEITTLNIEDNTKNENTTYQANEDEISLENDAILGGLIAYATFKGVKVVSSNPGLTGKPEISFELSYESKPYIDNLLLELYDNKEEYNVEMTRVASTGQELLTLNIDDPELSQQELEEKGKKLFTEVNNIMKNTDDKKDYEAIMPDELKNLKDKFVNDDPNIPDEDFKVGYTHENGANTYYLVANSKKEAIALSNLMGYEIKKDRGGNVFELNTEGKNMENTKLEKVTENINDLDEVKDTQDGISDVDINYNNKHYVNENYQTVEDFINDNKDPSTMSVVQIDVPEATPNQRVVNLASDDGTRETIIFNDGKEFDNYTLPKIAEVYGNGSSIDKDNTRKIEYDNGKAGYDALSSDNTYLRMNNFDNSVVDTVDNTLSNYMAKEETNSVNNKTNAYTKSLGSYPTNHSANQEAAKTSFATLIVFVLVMILGFAVIYLIFGG